MSISTEAIEAYYTRQYRGGIFEHDSPEFSRISMIHAIQHEMIRGLPNTKILNIGSGAQMLEFQMLKRNYGVSPKKIRRATGLDPDEFFSQFQFFSLDIADIPTHTLRGVNYAINNLSHTRADGLKTPFLDNTFGLTFSNMADFMPREEKVLFIAELARITQKDGAVLCNLHHPSLIPHNIEDLDLSHTPYAHWYYLYQHNLLFQSRNEIAQAWQSVGLVDVNIQTERDGLDLWWHVTAKKT